MLVHTPHVTLVYKDCFSVSQQTGGGFGGAMGGGFTPPNMMNRGSGGFRGRYVGSMIATMLASNPLKEKQPG